MPETLLPLGRDITLAFNDQVAVIREVGASLFSYKVGAFEVVAGPTEITGVGDVFKGSRGHVLMPWPNRVANGQYLVDGVTLQLPITEVARNNASAGFLRFFRWDVTEQSDAAVTMHVLSNAQMGYPFVLEATVRYELTDAGLGVRMVATNKGSATAPFGMGAHPYFSCGSSTIDNDSFVIEASRYLEKNDAAIPVGDPVAVDGTRFDFREPRSLTGIELDDCYMRLGRDENGIAQMSVANERHQTLVWMDEAFDYVMVYIPGTRDTIAIEPMSCAPDAFNNGLGLKMLEPGETFVGEWGVNHS